MIERIVPVASLIDTFFVRVDSSGTVAWLMSVNEDSVALPQPIPCDNPNLIFANCITIDAAFGDTIYTDPISGHTFVVTGSEFETVDIGGLIYNDLTQKCFEVAPVWWTCFIRGIGWYSGGSLASSILSYAKIGADEWGVERLSVGIESTHIFARDFEVHPIPVTDRLEISLDPPKHLFISDCDRLRRTNCHPRFDSSFDH